VTGVQTCALPIFKTLEAALAEFVNDPLCPKLVAEEFLESQEEEEKPAGI